MNYFVISDNVDTQTGMRLVGIEGIIAHTEQELSKAIDLVLSRKEIGILLLTEKLSTMCEEKILDIKLNKKKPLIVVIPDRHGTGRAPDSITSYVRESIGIKI